jgi:hypothetical protein
MADINTYALGLEFQMQTKPAMEAMGQLLDMAAKLQNKMSAAAASLSPSDTALEEIIDLTDPLEAMGLLTGQLERKMDDLAKAEQFLALATFESEQAAAATEETVFKLKHEIDDVNEAVKKLHKTWEKWPYLFEEHDKQIKNATRNFDINKRSIDRQHKSLKEQSAVFLSVRNAILGVTEETKQLNNIITAGLGKYGALAAALAFIGIGFKDVMEMQDTYAKVTFTAIGGQTALIASTNRLRATTGASSKEAIKALTALAEVGFRAEHNISALADANYKFSKATGVSESITAQFQRQIVAMGGSANMAKNSLAAMSAIIRNSGLTAKEAESLMSGFSKTMLRMALFGKTKEDFAATTTELGKLSGAFKMAGGSAESVNQQFGKMLEDPLEMAIALGKLDIEMDENASMHEKMQAYMKGTSAILAETAGMTDIERQKTLEARGVNLDYAASFVLLEQELLKTGKTQEQYLKGVAAAPDINKDWQTATSTLTEQLKQILTPIMNIASTIGSVLVPAATKLASVVSYLTTTFGKWWSDLQTNSPILANIISAVAVGAIGFLAFGAVASKLIGMFSPLTNAIKAVLNPIEQVNKTMDVAQKASSSAGLGVKTFLTNLGQGLKALAAPGALQGALILGVLAVIVGGTLLALAIAMKELGISVGELVGASVGLLIAAGAFYVMAAALAVLGPVSAIAAPLLLPLAVVFLAIGAAVLLASIGVSLMALAFTELFKAILPQAPMFVMIMASMAILMPALAIGFGLLAASLAISAPIILIGFGALLVAALMGFIINPVLERFANSLSLISSAMSGLGAGAGVSLLSLAIGITAFMASLMGIAVGGGIGSLFGVKNPVQQAAEIGAAMFLVAAPAAMLSNALGKLSDIGDIFKPFIDSVLGRKNEIAEAVSFISSIATQIELARKTINGATAGVGLIIPVKFAEPVRKPIITEDTARKIREERNQSNLVRGTEDMKNAIDKVTNRLDKGAGIGELVELLKIWLPKIAKPEDSGAAGLSSVANQWM